MENSASVVCIICGSSPLYYAKSQLSRHPAGKAPMPHRFYPCCNPPYPYLIVLEQTLEPILPLWMPHKAVCFIVGWFPCPAVSKFFLFLFSAFPSCSSPPLPIPEEPIPTEATQTTAPESTTITTATLPISTLKVSAHTTVRSTAMPDRHPSRIPIVIDRTGLLQNTIFQ